MHSPYYTSPGRAPRILPGRDAEGSPRLRGFELFDGQIVEGRQGQSLTRRQLANLCLAVMGFNDLYISQRTHASEDEVKDDLKELYVRTGIQERSSSRTALLGASIDTKFLAILKRADPEAFVLPWGTQEMVRLASQGLKTTEIAKELDWQPSEVNVGFGAIVESTGIVGRPAIVLGAIITGAIQPKDGYYLS